MLLAQDYITRVLSSDPEDESLTQSSLIISVIFLFGAPWIMGPLGARHHQLAQYELSLHKQLY